MGSGKTPLGKYASRNIFSCLFCDDRSDTGEEPKSLRKEIITKYYFIAMTILGLYFQLLGL